MNKKAYYGLLEEYQTLISQKQYSELLVDRARLEDVKKDLVVQIKTGIARNRVERIENSKNLNRIAASELEETRSRLYRLMAKIENEEPVTPEDWNETYHSPTVVCGLTPPQVLVVVLVSAVVTVLYKMFG